MGVVIPHQLDGVLHRDIVLPHEVCNLWVVLHGLRNQISSSTHSSVVQGHIEIQRLLEG